ncbi:MAG TPA: beta-propeller fold lactonase family protein, partial [Kofleriaceae bacterium]
MLSQRFHWVAAFSLQLALVACSSHPTVVNGDGGESTDDARPADGRSVDAGPTGDAGAGSTEFAYVANYLSGISAFAIQPNGELAGLPGPPFDAQVSFYAVALHPSRPILYAAEYTGHAVHAYQIDPEDGALSVIGQPIAIDHPAISIAVDPLGRFVYVGDFDDVDFANHSIRTFAIDEATGGLASDPLSSLPSPSHVSVIAPDPSGHFVYATDSDVGIRAFSVETSGKLSELTSSPFATTSARGGWLALHPTEPIIYNALRTLGAFTVESNGALTALPGSPFAGGANADPGEIAVAVDPHGRFMCVIDLSAATLTVYTIRGDGSVAVPGSSYDAGTLAYGVAIDPDGRFVYVTTDFGNVAA